MSLKLFLAYLAFTMDRPFEVLVPELAELRPMVILSVAMLISAVAYSRQTKAIAMYPVQKKLVIWFVVAMGMSRLANGWAGGVLEAMNVFMLPGFLMAAAAMNCTDMSRLKAACATLAFSTVILAIAGIASYHTGFMVEQLVLRQNVEFDSDEAGSPASADDIPALETSSRYLWRVRSVGNLGDPNDFGQAMVIAIPMLVGLYQKRRHVRNFFVVLLPVAANLYCIYLTHSRGALLGLASLVFFGVKDYLGTVRTAVLMGIGVVGAMAVNMTGGRAYTANEESAGGRIDAWSVGLDMLASHPLFGVGFGQFTDYHYYTAHNSFVLCFSENGVFGYFMWLGLIIVTFKSVNRAAQHMPADSEERRWNILLRSSILGFLTCALFLSRTYEYNLFVLLSLAMSAAYCAQISKTGQGIAELQSAPKWVKSTLILEVVSIAAIYLIVRAKHMTLG
jgi:putative inorganic carbon (HCO3(-)) transporter